MKYTLYRKLFFGFLFFLALNLLTGCAHKIASLRTVSQTPLDRQFQVNNITGEKNSNRTKLTLRMYNLEHSKEGAVRDLVNILNQIQETPEGDLLSSFSEVAYLEAKRIELSNPTLAAKLYIASALYAYYFLFDAQYEKDRHLYDSQVRDVCLLYNGSLERLLRLMSTSERKLPLQLNQDYYLGDEKDRWNLHCDINSGNWNTDEIEYFKFANDYEILGIENEYRQTGLGVPLIAKRKDGVYGKKEEKYYPKDLCFPVSAFLRPNFSKDKKPGDPDAVLELYDTMVSSYTTVNGKMIPLETDLTTPLACFLTNPGFHLIAKVGMFRPDELLKPIPKSEEAHKRSFKGLYMMQPYDPKKIPVIMVHGLGSSPMTWIEMFNSLRSIPEIREHYQFWFYFYPTGQPFWISASQMRDDLQEIRNTVDPDHQEIRLNEMVLVGHSMGGLISRLQVMESDDHFWNLISDRSFAQVEMADDLKDEMRKWFFFDPNPSVRRVITIATPFEGSEAANGFTKWLAFKAIALPTQFENVLANFFKTDRELIKDSTLLNIKTSVDSLAPDCPFFKAMAQCDLPGNVVLNNIVGELQKDRYHPWVPKETDGVVKFSSSRRKDVESEKIVPEEHMLVHTHPAAILETHRILKEHLYQMNLEEQQKSLSMKNIPPFPSRLK
ncbi:MAG: hypothetical protein Q4G69_13045 [Planctomycetia bacterium]|nr:hypothetical protein [Planctomycetia bacterium]